MPSTPTTNGRTKNQSKIIVLTLSSALLKRFVPRKESSSIASSPAPTIEEIPRLKQDVSQENNSDSHSTPAPPQDAPSPNGTTKPKITINGTNGVKRSTPIPSDGMPKPRGKPGPKKKPRLEDGTIDHSAKSTSIQPTTHKLGPKANTGFINANLRALDRTGTPCRRWQRNGFQLKSFTGHSWELSSWKGNDKSMISNGSDSSTKDISMNDSSDHKASETDTAAGSNSGDRPDGMEVSTPAASSPPALPMASLIPMAS